jgi:hypothetical protein
MDVDWAQAANTAASGLVALTCAVFAAVYHLHAPWRSTAVGRHVMMFTLAIGALGVYTVLITVWPDGAAAAVLRAVRTVLLVVIAGLVVQRTRMVLRAQRQGALQDAGHAGYQPPSD